MTRSQPSTPTKKGKPLSPKALPRATLKAMPSAPLASTSPSAPKPKDEKTAKFPKMTLPPPPIEIFDPMDDSRLTPEESMKLLDKWMDMAEGIECSDEVAEQQRMRLEKYQGPVTLFIDSPE